MKKAIPNLLVNWTMLMPDDSLSMVGGNTPEEKAAQVESYLKPLFGKHLNGMPLGEQQSVNLADGLQVPFDYKLADNKLEITVYDERDHKQTALLEMGSRVSLPYEIKMEGWLRDLILHLTVGFPPQHLGPRKLSDLAASIAHERDWHGFVLNQCRQWAKNYGTIHDDDFGQLMVMVGRNGGEPTEDYKTYEIADFVEHIGGDLMADAAALADVSCLAVQAQVFYYTDPTDWEHDCLGIPWDEEQRRTRQGETVILYPIH